MDGLIQAIPEATAGSGASIPLDLREPIMPYREQGGLSIRVERLPFKGRLSKGRNNGDNTWSLTLDDLDNLQYLPPEDANSAHTLTVRVISVDNDSASTLMRFDVPVDPGGGRIAAAPPPPTEAPSADPGVIAPAAQPAAIASDYVAPAPASAAPSPSWEAEEQIRLAAEAQDAARRAEAAAKAKLDQAEVQVAQEVENRLATVQASWEAEHQAHVAAAVQEAAQRAEADARSQLDQANEARLAREVERRLAEARASWESELQGRVAVAVEEATRNAETATISQLGQSHQAQLAQEVERRLAEARASWEAEHQSRVAAAVQEAAQRAEADARAQVDQANQAAETRLAQTVEHRLAEARRAWEGELQGRVAVAVEAALKEAEAKGVGLSNEQSEARIAQEVERRLSEGRASWEAEHQGRVAAAVQEAVQKANSDIRAQLNQENEARIAEVLQRRLGESRASWEAELQGRVATAVQDAVQRTESEYSVRLEQARQEGRDASGRELADMSARCVQAEAALAAARSHPPAGQDTDGTVRQLREDLASAQSLVRARESELAETRHSLDRARAEIAGYAREAEARVEKNRAAWNAERDTLLAQAEDNAQQRVKQALERWKHETEEAMKKAQKEWADAEETRLAVAEAQWRENIGIAKSRAPISKITKRQSWLRAFGRLKRIGIIAAFLVAAAVFIPSAKPLVVDTLWPKIVSFTGDLEPTIRKTTADVKKWLDNFMNGTKKPTRSRQRR